MKSDIKTALFCATIIIMFISFAAFVAVTTESREEQIWRNASDFGYEIGYINGKWTALEFIDYEFYEFDGQIYSIEHYDTVNISDRGSTWVIENGTLFVPDQIVIYKMKLDLCGFSWCDPSSYIFNTNGTRHVSFRYCRNGAITDPGYYRFYYLDVDIMEITHWEKW